MRTPVKTSLAAAVLAVAGLATALPASGQSAPPQERVIVKLKAGGTGATSPLSVRQLQEALRRPLSAEQIRQLEVSAGTAVQYVRPLPTGGHVLRLPSAKTAQATEAAIAALRARADVEYVEPDSPRFALGLPNDPRLQDMWHLLPVAPGSHYGADFVSAWTHTTGSPSVVVAVLDTGVLPHPDLVGPGGSVWPATGNLVSPGYTFISDCLSRGSCSALDYPYDVAALPPSPGAEDPGDHLSLTWTERQRIGSYWSASCRDGDSDWHGTHVAGTIAALGNNSLGITGGAYATRILPVRVLGKCGGQTSDLAEAILWASGVHPTIPNPHPAQVLNLSLGGWRSCSRTEQSAIDAAVAAGAVVVVAAGNDDWPVSEFSPASCANVITVAATRRDGGRASYSNFDDGTSHIALGAPGGDGPEKVLSLGNASRTAADPQGWIYTGSIGTSMAAPHVSAAVALMKARNPALTPQQVRALLTASSSVTPFPAVEGACTTLTCGAGLLNAALAVKNSLAMVEASPSALDFSGAPLGQAQTRELRLANGNPLLPATLGTLTLSGPGSAAYRKDADDCSGRTLAPGQSCTVALSLPRTTVGDFPASLEVPVLGAPDLPAHTAVVPLAGSASAIWEVAQPSIRLASLVAGQTGSATVSFRNIGPESLRTGTLQLSAPTAMALSSDGCSNVTLAPGASCSAVVLVSPHAAGEHTFRVSLDSQLADDPGATVTLEVAAQAPTQAGGSQGGGGGCTVLPSGTGSADVSLIAYAAAALVLLGLRRRRPAD